jgi:hypothetical protein
MSLEQRVAQALRAHLAEHPEATPRDLALMLRLLAKWRHQGLSDALVRQTGAVVQAGPFAGLRLGPHSTEGGHAPRLLGCYEQELHPHVERLIARGFRRVVNIGCADGYYAVGLARRLPGAAIEARDSSAAAREACAAVAAANGVAERVAIGGTVTPAELSSLADAETWLLVDIEGGEEALLDPAATPALRQATLLVECHEGILPGVTQRLAARFAPSHRVTTVAHALGAAALPPWLQAASHLDQLLAVWEWRSAPTPWLVLEPLPD